jgi:hypothetical protein
MNRPILEQLGVKIAELIPEVTDGQADLPSPGEYAKMVKPLEGAPLVGMEELVVEDKEKVGLMDAPARAALGESKWSEGKGLADKTQGCRMHGHRISRRGLFGIWEHGKWNRS